MRVCYPVVGSPALPWANSLKAAASRIGSKSLLGSKRTERFLAVDREPEMPDRVVDPTGEALAAREIVELPGVLGMSFDRLASLIGGLGVLA
jgi:hypothetical protein